MGIQEEASSIRKRKGKVQGSVIGKRVLTHKGIDYNEIFSLMVRHTSIMAVLALVAS